MIRTLTLRGLPGRDRSVTLDPQGATEIVDESGTGKTMLLVGLAALLTGDTLPAPRKDCAEAEVVGVTPGGTTYTATHRKSGMRWAIHPKGAPEAEVYSDRAAYRARLAELVPALADLDLVRVLVEPDRIHALLDNVGGRGFRDLVARLCGGDLVARVRQLAQEADAPLPADLVVTGSRGKRIAEDDPEWHGRLVAQLAERQTETGRAERAAEADLHTAEGAAAALEAQVVPAPADEDALRQARTTLATAEAWRGHDEQARTHEAAVERVKQQRAARDAWDRANRELGPEPTPDAAALIRADTAVREAQAEVTRLERAERDEETRRQVEAALARGKAEAVAHAAFQPGPGPMFTTSAGPAPDHPDLPAELAALAVESPTQQDFLDTLVLVLPIAVEADGGISRGRAVEMVERANFLVGLDDRAMARGEERQLGKVLTELLREVDPNVDPDHIAHLPSARESA